MINILLYGATGYTGRLIASEMKRWNDERRGVYRMVLAARDRDRLRKVADRLDMEYRVFGLDHRPGVRSGLNGMNVVINAAGPFAWTAERLATVAIEVECHYVDVNGEADVYLGLKRQLEVQATMRGVALVSAAGFWAAASDWLLDTALRELLDGNKVPRRELGAIRIAMSRIGTFTRASAATVVRSQREQVIVVRKGEIEDVLGATREGMVLWHEPVGKLERAFDFLGKNGKDVPSIASAASLVDTLTARHTVDRHGVMAGAIESYVEMDRARRFAYQLGSMFAPLAAIPAVRGLVQQPISLLAEGPTRKQRGDEPHVIVLDIEDAFHARILHWRWNTPNVYSFTGQLAVAVATQIAAADLTGWRTPAEALRLLDRAGYARAFRDATLEKRNP